MYAQFCARLNVLVFLCLSALSTPVAAASTGENLVRCRFIDDPEKRLSCYDALALPSLPQEPTDIQRVRVDELLDDIDKFRGINVEIQGYLVVQGRLAFLRPTNGPSIAIDVTGVRYKDKVYAFENCQMIGNSWASDKCSVIVRGKVEINPYSKEPVSADTIKFQ